MPMRFAPTSSRYLLGLALFVGSIAPGSAPADPPEYFARLIEEGNVSFDFYDPVQQPRTHRGYTTFQLDVHYRSTYQYQWVNSAGGRRVTIEPKIAQMTYALVNQVQLPKTLNHDRRWTTSLVKHEFDHVAMTLDPRVRFLIEHLCERTPEIVRDLPAGTPVTDRLIDRVIHDTVEPRYQSVVDLLIANENDLDQVTRHGHTQLADRRKYFESLFTESNLQQHRFPYVREVRPLLRTKRYRNAKLPYDFGR